MPTVALLVLPLALTAACLEEGPRSIPKEAPAGAEPERDGTGDPPLEGLFEDHFERSEVGPDWLALSPAWRIREGRLCVEGARNRGIWLRRTLPRNARIEVTAIAGSEAGDLKVELWGDGRTGATGTTYDDATSYLAILGGWSNSRHVFARLSEHGEDRLEVSVSSPSDDPRQRAVAPGQPYRFRFERRDGTTVRWEVDGATLFELDDLEPLTGPGHDHLGLNDWEAPVCFDDLRIEPLSPRPD